MNIMATSEYYAAKKETEIMTIDFLKEKLEEMPDRIREGDEPAEILADLKQIAIMLMESRANLADVYGMETDPATPKAIDLEDMAPSYTANVRAYETNVEVLERAGIF